YSVAVASLQLYQRVARDGLIAAERTQPHSNDCTESPVDRHHKQPRQRHILTGSDYPLRLFLFQAEDGIRDRNVTGVQTCALPICAGIGSFIVGNNGKAIKGTLKALPLLFRRSKYTKAMYMDLLALLYRLMAKSRQMGMFSLERDIENPRESEIFASYPLILADSVMLDFIVDYLRLIISGHMNTFEIEALMDEEIETHESEAEVPANSLALVGDSLPA